MDRNRVPPGDLGNWNDDEVDLFEQAQQALRLLIGAYSARIDAAGPGHATDLLQRRARTAEQLRQLDPSRREALEKVVRDTPALLQQQLRAER
jgi:hypothetical protein